VNGTSNRNTYTATAGQTAFAATYDPGYVDAYLNGVKLISGTDFTATSGTSIVLASGAAVGDTVDIVGFGTFVVADTYTKTQADARYVDVAGDTMTGDLTVAGEVVADELIIAGVSNSFSSNAGNGTIITTNNGGSFPFNESGSLLYRPRQNDTDGRGNHYFYTGATPKLRQNIAPNGDISFYEDTGTTAKFFWDASAERLGIGSSSLNDATLEIRPATDIPQIKITQNNVPDGGDGWKLHASGPTGGNLAIIRESSGSDTEAVRIHTTGNLQMTGGGSVGWANWTIVESGGSLYFATGGSNKMKLDASGNLDVVGNVNSNATIT
jgi:hypothetical protein